MGFLMKYKKEIFFFALLVLVFFFTRLYRLDSLPMFTDEAIYVRWAQIAKQDASWRFISLTDGKQPSFIWIAMIVMRLASDPLVGVRLVSVIAGFFTVIGLFFLGKEIFRKPWIGLISSLLYVIFPMSLVYDRMALYDSLVGTFTVWGLFIAIVLVRTLRLDVALILGMVAGSAVLTKTSGFFTIYLLPCLFLLFDWKKQELRKRFVRFLGLLLLVIGLTYGYYSILRLSPFFYIIAEKNALFVFPVKDWINHPFYFFWGNIKGVWDWFITYISWPWFFLIIGSFFVRKDMLREKIVLVLWFLTPFVGLALFGKVLYPRFIFFMILSLLPLIAYTIITMSGFFQRKILFVIFLLVILVLPLRADYFIITDFSNAPIPKSDLGQYINGWPAGGGAREIVSFLEKEAAKQKIYVLTDGTFGSLPTYMVEIYLGENKNIEKRGIWPLPSIIPQDITEKALEMPVYVVFNQTQDYEIPTWPITFITKYKKGLGDSYMSLYIVDKEKIKKK